MDSAPRPASLPRNETPLYPLRAHGWRWTIEKDRMSHSFGSSAARCDLNCGSCPAELRKTPSRRGAVLMISRIMIPTTANEKYSNIENT
eukprot:scaffold48_cov311-Pinguiococcus_pyrenoidosus.AAC.335